MNCKWFGLIPWSILAFLTVALTGCGGDDNASSGSHGGGNPPPQRISKLHAMDASLRAAYSSVDRPISIDLTPYVTSEVKTTKSLSSITSLNYQPNAAHSQKRTSQLSTNCKVIDVDNEHLRFTIPTNQKGLCLFRYVVEDSTGELASGLARILIAPAKNGQRLVPITNGRHQLPDLYRTVNMGSQLNLDLRDELALLAPSLTGTLATSIFSESIAAFGGGTSVLTDEGQFTFTPVAIGTSEVVYWVLGDNDTPYNELDDDIYTGHIYIDVSGLNSNTPPIALAATATASLEYGETSTDYDLAAFNDKFNGIINLIGDVDGDSVQLINVTSSDVNTWVSEPNDITNTKFKIQARYSRAEGKVPVKVRYTVYDHNEDGVASNDITFTLDRKLVSLQIYLIKHSAVAGSSEVSIPKGASIGFGATGVFSDGSSADMTTVVNWNSTNATVAPINNYGIVSGDTLGDTIINASYTSTDFGSIIASNAIPLKVTKAALTSVSITPSSQSLPLGAEGKITAIGNYTDSSSKTISELVTWLSGPVGIVSVDNSMSGDYHPYADVLARSIGHATITANIDGLTSNEAIVDVGEAIVSRLQLTPVEINLAKGLTQYMVLDAIYSNGDVVTISSDTDVEWRVVEPGSLTLSGVAAFTNSSEPNQIEALKKGQADIIATYKGIESNRVNINITEATVTDLQLTPSRTTLPQGLTVNMLVKANFTDGSQRTITDNPELVWENDNTTASIHTGNGTFQASNSGAGESHITVTYQGKRSNQAIINVTDAIVQSIKITPLAPISIPKGLSQQLNATAFYSNGTSRIVTEEASWITKDNNVATITTAQTSGNGFVTAAADPVANNTTVTASFDEQVDTVALHITPAIPLELEVAPQNPSIAKGLTQHFTAMLTMSDGNSRVVTEDANLTWRIEATDPNITISNTTSNKGEVFGGATGSGEVSATYDNGSSPVVTNHTFIEVTNAEIIEVNLTPLEAEIRVGESINITAAATLTDNDKPNITEDVDTAWKSSNKLVATVVNGEVTGVKLGEVEVSTQTNKPYLTHPIVSNSSATIKVTCGKLGGNMIDIVRTNSGKFFTSSPSKAYIDANFPSHRGESYNDVACTSGPSGYFYIYNISSAMELCQAYNSYMNADGRVGVGGRTDWSLASLDDLKDLYDENGNMYIAQGWPVITYYWSSTWKGGGAPKYWVLSLKKGTLGYTSKVNKMNFSCVSGP